MSHMYMTVVIDYPIIMYCSVDYSTDSEVNNGYKLGIVDHR